MLMLAMKNMTKNTMYIVQELRAFIFNESAFTGIVFSGIAFKVS